MKKISFFLIFFLIFSHKTFADTSITPKLNKPFCQNKISQEYLKDIDKLHIKKIEVDIDDFRKWTINSIRIITGNFRFIPNKYKKRYKANVLVTYENNIQCNFKARIRHSGDAKDHISLHNNTILQSLDIHLESGNIRGITKFKLFKPEVRGKIEDVIILTELLRNLNYLTPRTIKVDGRINQAESVMLFQEKAAKEMLEYNNRREGPILEGDQKFFFKLVQDLPSNQLSNEAVGTPALRSESIKTMLAKQSNSGIILKSENHKIMSYDALTNLNLIYLYYSNKFQDEKNNFHFFDYDLDNTLLGFFNSKNILKLDIYNLIMQSSNSQHGLSVSNRKFYWNSIENYFEPILYDSNANIDIDMPTTTTSTARLPISKEFYKAIDLLELKLNNLDLNKIHKNLILAGINLTKKDLNLKINKIIFNLGALKKNYFNLNKDMVEHNKFKLTNDNIFDRFNNTLSQIDSGVILVKHNENNGQLQKCKIYLKMCKDFNISKENLLDLLEGELILDKKIYQYLGKNLDFKNIADSKNYNKLKFKKTTIYYNDGIVVKLNPDNNLLNINQNIPGARIYIMGGELENLIINFNGYEKVLDETVLQNYPIDIKGLTGCLSLINLKIKNISISSNKSTCEDAVNIINVKGKINSVEIKNSLQDGLDIDFSELKILDLNIKSSKNDCVDLSYGEYELINVNVSDCGDKGISVGEKSFLILNKINVNKAKIGIAIKDSSNATIKNLDVRESEKCINIYRKKQEFSGAIVNLKVVNCHNAIIEQEAGSFINRNTL